MNLFHRIVLFLLLNLFQVTLFAEDTEKIKALRALAQNTKDSVKLAHVLTNLGWEIGFYDLRDGLKYCEEGLRLAEKYKDTLQMAQSSDAVGAFYSDMGYAERAVEFHLKAIRLYAFLPDAKIGLGNAYLNIARVYNSMGDYEKTIEYDLQALPLFKQKSYYKGLATLYGNLGLVYSLKLDIDSAIHYYTKSLALNTNLKDSINIARLYFQLGYMWHRKKLESRADEYIQRSIAILLRNNSEYNLISAYAALGDTKKEQGKIDEAIDAYRKSLVYALKSGQATDIKGNYFELYQLYEKKGDTEQAYFYFKLYVRYKDTVMSEDNLNKIKLTEAKYENKNKQKEIERLQLETRNKQLEAEKQKWLRNAFVFMLLLAVLSVIILNKQSQERRKNNLILEKKNKLISEQNKDITDSINYAQKIQQALLPSSESIRNLFPNSFIFFQPRNVVSGDFYWASAHKDSAIIAAVDCTGHGVPGAFMSMIGNTLLNQIVNESEIIRPAEILFHLCDEVIKSLKQTGASGESRDGMDIALCTLKPLSKTAENRNYLLEFSGANNPLIVIKQGVLTEYKGDKQPIGIYSGTPKPFSSLSLELESGDLIYLYSDGYADQFGGPQNKKFKYSQLKELLVTIAKLPMHDQCERLKTQFENWKANNEQVDDVLVIGIKIG